MRIVATSILSIAMLGSAITPGWCPQPADLGAPIGRGPTGATAAAVGSGYRMPSKHRQGMPSEAGNGLHLQSYTSRGAVTGAQTPSNGKLYRIRPSTPQSFAPTGRAAPQPSPASNYSNSAMDRLH